VQVNDVHKHGEAHRKVDIAPCDVHAWAVSDQHYIISKKDIARNFAFGRRLTKPLMGAAETSSHEWLNYGCNPAGDFVSYAEGCND